MENICTDAFWNSNLTWGNHRKYPEFTECFQDTVIVLLPSVWLWVTAPLYVYVLLKFKDAPVQWSWKSLMKMSIVMLQLSTRYLQLGQAYDRLWNIRYIGLLAEGATLFLVMWYIDLERRKGFVTSGILTIYWFLASLCGAILLYSNIVRQGHESGGSDMLTTYFILTVVQFVLTWFADIRKQSQSKRECGLSSASFISRCFFTWFDRFMSLGYKRPIEEGDISSMLPSEQPENTIPTFEHAWTSEQRKLQDHKSAGKTTKVGLMKVLIKANWCTLLGANLLLLVAEVFIVSKPLITGLLVGFAVDMSQPAWKGYLYLLAGVMGLLSIGIIGTYVEHLCICVGLRINMCLTDAVFKKSMRMTNRARCESTVGKIINLVSNDVDQIKEFFCYFFWVWSDPLELVCCMAILFYTVEHAALAGVCVLALIMPLNIFLARKDHSTYIERMDRKDDRIKLMTEILNGIKILKLYAWEMVFGDKILEIRNEELSILKKQRILGIIEYLCMCIAPYMMGLATFVVYVYISDDHMLTAATAFQAWATFGKLSRTFNSLPHIVSHLMRSSVSMKRVESFLNNEELPDDVVTHTPSDYAITVEEGTFTWDEKLGPCLKHINISLPKGSLVAVVGSVGSGKSSLLSAVLGEMEKDQGKVNVHGSIAYVSQLAWIQNNTLRDNVLFGQKYREQTYNDVIDACCLRRDLDILPGKDMTEIGEQGINLSGGQKQRVSLARAAYSNADIYLLDDPLSAVDAHVGKDIFESVISHRGLLKNKTRVLVTHGIAWLPRVDMVIVIENGTISETGTYEDLIRSKGSFADFIKKYKQEEHSSDDEENKVDGCSQTAFKRLMSDSGYTSDFETTSVDPMKSDSLAEERHGTMFKRSISRALSAEDKCISSSNVAEETKLIKLKTFDDKFKMNEERIKREAEKCDTGKLIEDEEIETGKVKFKYILPYFKAIGIFPCIFIIVLLTGCKVNEILQSVCLKEWTDNKALNNLTTMPRDSEERYEANSFYIRIYILIGICFCITSLAYVSILSYSVLKTAKQLHEQMLKNILRGPMSFFDTTPVGRITNRFSRDIEPLDGNLSNHTETLLHCVYELVSVFIVILMTLPALTILALPIFIVYREIQKRFVPVRRQLSRLVSNKRSPVYSHLTESLNGVHVIRAFDMQKKFASVSAGKVNDLCETIFHNRTVDRWMDLRLVLLNAVCFAATTYFVIQERGYLGGAVTGMVMWYVLEINSSLDWFVHMSGELEKDVVCIERIGQYSSTKQEAPLHTAVLPAKNWPDSGAVKINNYSIRYRDGLDLVLKNINVNVKPGEKVGIVGRTGAGKSSLTLGLFRLIEPAEGSICIDEQDISKLGLFDLRSNLTILPQEPVLFSGTLKTNLDPLNAHTDEDMFTALQHAHLKSFIDTLPGQLNYECGEGGRNLSVGQRQLICLARSLLRKSRILVLDEATAAVDMKTDELIQNTIKMEFKDCTVLTIAHRLNTIIDYDRILVLEHGKVKEFETPKNLLQNKDSVFYSMAKDAGLVK